MKTKRVLLFPVILVLLVSQACTDSNLQTVSKALTDVAYSVGTLQTTAIEANKAGLLSEDNTRALLELCVKTNLAGKEAVAVTRGISKLDDPSKAQIMTILQPVVVSVRNMVDNGLLGIKNEDTKRKVQTILVVIQTGLNSIQLVVAARG